MLNLNFTGVAVMFYKFPKEKVFFTTGMKNLYFFFYFLKKCLKTNNVLLNFYFKKSKSNPIMILKSPIQYKISKHLVSKHRYKFSINVTYYYDCNSVSYEQIDWFNTYFCNYKRTLIFSNPLFQVFNFKSTFSFCASKFLIY